MIFQETPLRGAYVIEPQRTEDHRGFFARTWCRNELRQRGLKTELAQSNVGFSHHRGTLRGLHFQEPPHAEVKIVRCTRGSMFDVIVDLRPDSPTYKRWFGIELSQENCTMLYVPEGCAQGYITLVDNTEMCYQTSEFYHPESASGVRHDDPEFDIVWPIEVSIISQQDQQWPDYSGRRLPISVF
jgi:dTDP-4-dehydrorhamnose 3,5-epimerase